jgi:hypothetical protein
MPLGCSRLIPVDSLISVRTRKAMAARSGTPTDFDATASALVSSAAKDAKGGGNEFDDSAAAVLEAAGSPTFKPDDYLTLGSPMHVPTPTPTPTPRSPTPSLALPSILPYFYSGLGSESPEDLRISPKQTTCLTGQFDVRRTSPAAPLYLTRSATLLDHVCHLPLLDHACGRLQAPCPLSHTTPTFDDGNVLPRPADEASKRSNPRQSSFKKGKKGSQRTSSKGGSKGSSKGAVAGAVLLAVDQMCGCAFRG